MSHTAAETPGNLLNPVKGWHTVKRSGPALVSVPSEAGRAVQLSFHDSPFLLSPRHPSELTFTPLWVFMGLFHLFPTFTPPWSRLPGSQIEQSLQFCAAVTQPPSLWGSTWATPYFPWKLSVTVSRIHGAHAAQSPGMLWGRLPMTPLPGRPPFPSAGDCPPITSGRAQSCSGKGAKEGPGAEYSVGSAARTWV